MGGHGRMGRGAGGVDGRMGRGRGYGVVGWRDGEGTGRECRNYEY